VAQATYACPCQAKIKGRPSAMERIMPPTSVGMDVIGRGQLHKLAVIRHISRNGLRDGKEGVR